MTTRKVVESELDSVPELEPEGELEMTQPEQVAVVIDPVVVNPMSAQPAPHLKPEWDEPELDPVKRYSIAEDPDGSKNAARLGAAIERHQAQSSAPPT